MARVAESRVEITTLVWLREPRRSTAPVVDTGTNGGNPECANHSGVVPMEKSNDAIGPMMNNQSVSGVVIPSC
jgi:hypothetical protein